MAHDPDDWFDEPQVDDPPRRRAHAGPSAPPAGAGRRQRSVDDWIRELSPRRTETERRPAPGRRAVIVAVVAVAVLLGVLAAAGVFSSSGRRAAPPTTPATTPRAPTTTAQTAPVTTGPVVPSAPTTTLKPGDSGDRVKALQRALAYLGFSVATVDGSYGPATQHAVAGFQKSKGLAADGVVGPKTLQALTAALSP